MKVGDLVVYKYDAPDVFGERALVLYVNDEGGTLKVLDSQGKVDWFVTSYCEVISEGG
jgi:hypothetical protein